LTDREASELIRPAVRAGEVWADLGAGSGTFTRALAQLIGEKGEVIAIERDQRALRDLQRLRSRSGDAPIQVVEGDITNLHLIGNLATSQLDGALFANVLHFIREPDIVLDRLRSFMHAAGRVIVVEYDARGASRWVPYPLPFHQLAALAKQVGLAAPVEIGRRKSRYQGELYAARMSWGGSDIVIRVK
jgi:ubiquinone/menaquinone biosynthesis C-methylase UbiE